MKYSPFEKNEIVQPNIDSGTEPDGVELLDNPIVFDYYVLKNNYLRSFVTPKNLYVTPSKNDYITGIFKRYFIQKRNDPNSLILELDKNQYSILSPTSGIDSNLYYGIIIDWKITGPENDIVDPTGVIIEYGIKDTNDRTLQLMEQQMSGISNKLKNLKEFSRRT